MTSAPILYSFRRCPYAIRARLALRQGGLAVELREVNLQAKPPELLEASAKGTVPVLVRPDRTVLDQSLAVMVWALRRHDPEDWLRSGDEGNGVAQRQAMDALIATNDGRFKRHLDRFRYADRHPGARMETHRGEALAILRQWNGRLERGGWLLEGGPSLADWALLPFVRQFRLADPAGFEAEPGLSALQGWLRRFLEGPDLAAVMGPPWAARQPWRSPRLLYHLALAEEWQAARAAGVYRRSSRGLGLEEVGFIHASDAHQLADTFARFYGDARSVVLLTIDPQRLQRAGVAVKREPAPPCGELFPHLYGPLPLEAVLQSEPYTG